MADKLLLTETELVKLEIDWKRNIYGIIDFSKLVAKTQLAKADPQGHYEQGRKDERVKLIQILGRKHLDTNGLLLDRQWLYREIDPDGSARQALKGEL